MALLFINKVPGDRNAYEKKLNDISMRLGIDPDWLQFLIDFESAGTFRASIENSFSCIGLIQFCSNPGQSSWPFEQKYKTIGGKKVMLSTLKSMSNVEQLEYVYEYLRPYRSELMSFYDLYFSILWPDSLGEPDDYIIRTGTNPIFDLNNNGIITKGEVKQFLDNRVQQLVPSNMQGAFKKKELFCRFIKGRLSRESELSYC